MKKQQNIPEYIKSCPIIFDWCHYKGEEYFGVLNWEGSQKRGYAMIDLCYCATKAMNNIVEKTVKYDARKFTADQRSSRP